MSTRFTMPPVGAASSVVFPTIHRHALGNGMRAWFIPHTGVPAVTITPIHAAASKPGTFAAFASGSTPGASALVRPSEMP